MKQLTTKQFERIFQGRITAGDKMHLIDMVADSMDVNHFAALVIAAKDDPSAFIALLEDKKTRKEEYRWWNHPEDYPKAAQVMGYDVGYVRKIAYMHKRIDERLLMSYYMVGLPSLMLIADLPEDHHEKFLQMVFEQNLTVAALRDAINEFKSKNF
jgi:hypothetical protein